MATSLPSRCKSYYHRITIPVHLRQHFAGREEVWRSLHTLDKEETRVNAGKSEAQGRQLFLTLKSHDDRMEQSQIDELVEHWLDSELDEADDYRALSGPLEDEYCDDVSLILSDQLEEARLSLRNCDYRIIEKKTDGLIHAAGFPALNREGADFGRLCRRLLQAKEHYLRTQIREWSGNGAAYQRKAQRPLQPASVSESKVKSSPRCA